MDKKINASLGATVTDFQATLPMGGVSLKGFELDNLANAAVTYLNVYGVPAAQVVVGTTVPIFSWPIGGQSAQMEPGNRHKFLGQATTGLSANVSTLRGGSVAPSSTTVYAALYFEQ